MDLSKYTQPELRDMRELLNLTEDELEVFNMLSKGKSIQQISEKIQMSTRSVDRRIKHIKCKMGKLNI